MGRTLTPIVTLLLLSLTAVESSAQVREEPRLPEPANFGEITDSLFTLEHTGPYPYEYLLRQIRVGFFESGGSIQAALEHHYRIRVLTDDPVRQAEAAMITVPFHHADRVERVEGVEAATYHPEGRRFFLEDDAIRTAELNSRYSTLEFMMPEVREGAILEVRYRLLRNYIEELPDIYLAQSVPTRQFHLMLHNEPFLRYRAVEPEQLVSLRHFEELIDTSAVPRVFTYRRPEPVSIEHWYGSLPAVEDPVYSPPVSDLRGALRLQISEFGIPRQPLENSWEFVVALIRRGELNPWRMVDGLETVRKQGAALAAGVGGEQAVMEEVFQWLNRRALFNGEYQPFPVTPLEGVLEGEPSDQAAVNLVLLALLEGAGLEAWPVLVSGRNRGEIEQDFPSIHQFTQLIILTDIDGKRFWLDGSYPHSRPDLIRPDSFHDQGLLLKRDSFSWLQVEPSGSRFDLQVRLNGELSADGDLDGEVEIIGDGYPAREMWVMLARQATAEELFRELFFELYESIRFSEASVEQVSETGYPLRLTGRFRIPGYALSFRDGLQFHPMVLGHLEQNPLPEEERSVPLLLDAPERLVIDYRLRLPDGYRLREQSDGGRTGLSGAELTERYRVADRDLAYRFEVEIGRRGFSAEEYEALRQFYERWVFLSNDEWFISREAAP